MKNIFYFRHINEIGGVETMFYMLAKKYHDRDMTIFFTSGDPKQIARLRKYVRVRQHFKGEKIKCEKAFFNYNLDIIDDVEADEYVQVIHCDFKQYAKIGVKPNINPKINKYIAVSHTAANAFEEITGIKPEVCYNPLLTEKPKKILHLITASRLTMEKGKDRMIKLADQLDAAGIPYIWTVFTNDTNAIRNPNVIFMKPRIDGITDFIADADYLVQLSDTEGYSYSIIESLSVGTPVIVTDLPVLTEMKVENGVNGFILPFDMNDIPIEKIYEGLQPFVYEANKDRWDKIMAKGKSTYKAEQKEKVTIKPVKKYFDLQMNRLVEASEQPFQVTRERAETLIALGVVKIIEDGKKPDGVK